MHVYYVSYWFESRGNWNLASGYLVVNTGPDDPARIDALLVEAKKEAVKEGHSESIAPAFVFIEYMGRAE